MKKSTLRWALLGTGLVFALGLGSCNASSLGSILPLALIGTLLQNGGATDTAN